MTYIITVTGYGLRLSYKIVGNEAVLEALDIFHNDCKRNGFKIPSKWWDLVDCYEFIFLNTDPAIRTIAEVIVQTK